MLREPDTQKDSAVAVNIPWRVRQVQPLKGYRLRVVFADGLEGAVDLSRLVNSEAAGVFSSLRDEAMFRAVFVDFGAVAWPGGIDLAPDAMHAAIAELGEWVLQ